MRDREGGFSSVPSLLHAAKSPLRTSSSATNVVKQPSDNSALVSGANLAKLRNLNINIQEQREAIRQKKERIEQIVNETDNFREEADVDAKRVEVSVLRQKVNAKRQLIGRLTEARDEFARRDERRDEKAEEIEAENAESQAKLESLVETTVLMKKQIKIVGAELILRKRLMMRDLVDLFPIRVDLKVDFKQKRSCTCFTLDMINNLHLPYTNCLTGHNDVENELVAAVEQVAHILRQLSIILDHPMRYPVGFVSARPTVVDNFTSEKFTLSKMRSRSDRELFEKGLTLIGKNVAQFRADCGLACAKPERILFNIRDLLIYLAGRMKIVPKHARPTDNFASPSSLLIIPKSKYDNAALNSTINSLSETISPDSPVRWRESTVESNDKDNSGSVVLSPSKRTGFCYSSYSATSPQNSSPP